MAELGEASWISSGGNSLYGWVHRPSAAHVKGAVVIAPPLAREQVISHRTLRVLAIMLAQQGWVAIRFGWTGTGESAPMPANADVVETWQQDLQAVVGLAERLVGTQPVHAIGLRAGAALLASAPLSVHKRLLWEPIGGRMFLRQQSMLRAMSLPAEPVVPADAGLELNGTFYLPHQVASLSAVPDPAKAAAGALPAGSEVVFEADNDTGRKIHSVASIHATVPIDSLQKFIAGLPQPERLGQQATWSPVRQATLAVEGTGSRVIEEIVGVGPDQLPGVYCRPLGSSNSFENAAFLVAASAEPKDGVTALWVTAARRLAARGVPALRAERRGSGDLGCPEAVMDPNPYTLEAIEDTENTAAWLQAKTGGSVTGIGLCVGAWLVGMASEHSPIDRVVMLNNVAWRPDTAYFEQGYAALDPADYLLEALNAGGDKKNPTMKSRIKELLREKGPYPLWLALGRRSIANTPEVLMEISSRQAQLQMYFGPEDQQQFELERGPAGLQRLQRSGRSISSQQKLSLDHAVLGHESRLQTLEIIEGLFPTRPAVQRHSSSAATSELS